jgi:hypothetical protein
MPGFGKESTQMAQFHLFSEVNQGGTRARVYIENMTGNRRFLATVRRADGFWHVDGTTSRLLPLIPHTAVSQEGKRSVVREVPLGEVIKSLREKVMAKLGVPVGVGGTVAA